MVEFDKILGELREAPPPPPPPPPPDLSKYVLKNSLYYSNESFLLREVDIGIAIRKTEIPDRYVYEFGRYYAPNTSINMSSISVFVNGILLKRNDEYIITEKIVNNVKKFEIEVLETCFFNNSNDRVFCIANEVNHMGYKKNILNKNF
ncbi:MAG: hypothetical protein PHP31_07560 [Lentimicrobiaceae bacterium]|nr:hypothetical protein [Lentimicrobiaceae bacterium]